MNFGGINIITSRFLPDGKFYLVGEDIVMSVNAYKRSFGWDILADRMKDDFKAAEAEFNRACRSHGIARTYAVWIRDYDPDSPAESAPHIFSKTFFSTVQTPLVDLLQQKP